MPAPANDQPGPLSRLEALAAAVTLKDDDLLAAGPRRERLEAVHDLGLVVLVGLLQFGVWGAAFITFGAPLLAAIPSALLISAIITAVDVRIVASDTTSRGVLRQGALPWSFWWMLGCRLFISLVLANVTSTAVDLLVFRPEAIQAAEKERNANNRPLMADYEQRLAALRARELGPLEDEIANLTNQRAHVLSERSRAGDKIVTAREDAASADLERERQVYGVDARAAGDGPIAKDAAKRRELAAEQAQFLADRQRGLAQDADRLGQEITAASTRLTQMRPRFAEEVRKLEAERETRLIKATSGPLTVVMGLLRLREDPERGPSVWFITFLAWSGVMTLELAFFLVRLVFKPASVHDLAVNTDTQRRAATLAHDFADHIREARRRQPLRVVGADDPVP